jgi:hypothetical protein
MAGPGRRPGTGGLLRGTSHGPIATLPGGPSGLAQSGAAECLTGPLSVEARPAPGSLGYQGPGI